MVNWCRGLPIRRYGYPANPIIPARVEPPRMTVPGAHAPPAAMAVPITVPMTDATPETILQRLGGETAVRRWVTVFYEAVSQDALLAPLSTSIVTLPPASRPPGWPRGCHSGSLRSGG